MNKKEIEKKLKEYEKQGFDDWQLYEIRKGLENGVDVTKYTDLELSDEEMAKIRKELFQDNLEKDQVLEVEEKENSIDKNIDINNMNIDSFNIGQQKQIEWGLEAGIDVKEYADPKFHWNEMEEIKKEIEEKSKKGIYWHKITRRTPTEEEKDFYNYKNFDTIFEGLPAYEEEVLVTNGKSAWLDSFDEDENGIYLSGTGNEADDVLAWAEIKIPNFNSLAESGAEGKTT